MNTFNWQRFLRVIGNDLMLLNARRVAMITLGLMGSFLLFYMSNVGEPEAANAAREPMSYVMFPILLIGGGIIFTSTIYGDMHHPLERFQYLTLPVSSLERFVSRYLITGPFYYVYAVIVFYVFEWIAALIIRLTWDLTFMPFDLGSDAIKVASILYFAAHAVMYTGAIYSRSHALIRTGATLFALWAVCVLLMLGTMRILYWDSFESFFVAKPDARIDIRVPEFLNFEGSWTLLHKAIAIVLFAWVLFLGYLGLRYHEVQDGL
jgi:hypothetical protein